MARKNLRSKDKPKKLNPTAAPADRMADEKRLPSLAQVLLRPSVQAACTIRPYSAIAVGLEEVDIESLIAELSAQVKQISDGDLRRAEAMLIVQAHTLDAVFNTLARRAAKAEYMPALEGYLRLALKAQSQCRATLETLALVKNPAPVAFVRQANIGQAVQVNNAATAAGEASRAEESENTQTKLLEAQHGERLDREPTSTTGRANPNVAAVEKLDGTQVG